MDECLQSLNPVSPIYSIHIHTLLNYKFRLYPTSEQEARLVGTLGACRWVYNYFIKLAGHGFLTKEDMNYALTELKEQEP